MALAEEKNFAEFLRTFTGCPAPLVVDPTTEEMEEVEAFEVGNAISQLFAAVEPPAEWPVRFAQFQSDFGKLQLRSKDIIGYKTDYLPATWQTDVRTPIVTKTGTLKTFNDSLVDAEDKLLAAEKAVDAGEGGSDEKLETAKRKIEELESHFSTHENVLTELRQLIESAVKDLRVRDLQVRKYYAGLKKLSADIKYAEDLAATPADAWNAAKTAFLTQKVEVINAVTAKDYALAHTELLATKKKIDELVEARLVGLRTEITNAAESVAMVTVVGKLKPTEIEALTSGEQLSILETLRKTIKCTGCAPATWWKLEDITGNSGDCPDCGADDQFDLKKQCKKCTRAFAANPCTHPCDGELVQYFECPDGSCDYSSSKVTSGSTECPNCGPKAMNAYGWKCPVCAHWTASGGRCAQVCGENSDGEEAYVVSASSRMFLPQMEARAKIFTHMPMDKDFVKEDVRKRKKVIDKIRTDPGVQAVYQEAEENWSLWTSNPATYETELKRFFNTLIKTQCEIMGHKWEFGDTTKTRTFDHGDEDFDKNTGPVKIRLSAATKDGQPNRGLFGQCEPGFPTILDLNTNCRQLGDFREYVDTILHENSHAYQEMLIKKLQGKDPYDTPPTGGGTWADTLTEAEKKQARLFAENDESYFNRDTLKHSASARQLSSEAYRSEPLEDHAWTTGAACSTALLIPPQIRSMDSSAALANKTWFLSAISRQSTAVVRTKERHGVYSDLWEGEKPGDKKLKLVLKGGSHDVRIQDVKDEYQLTLNFDATTLPERIVAAEGAVIDTKAFDGNPEIMELCRKPVAQLKSEQDQLDAFVNGTITRTESGGYVTLKDGESVIAEGGEIKDRTPLNGHEHLIAICRKPVSSFLPEQKSRVTTFASGKFDVDEHLGYLRLKDAQTADVSLAKLVLDESVADLN